MQKIKLWIEKVVESFTACAICMVQGDLSVLSLPHFVTAGKVGLLTGLAFVIASFIKTTDKLVPIYLTGIFVAVSDFIVHPSGMVNDFVEPIVTGTFAMLLAYVYQKVRKLL